MPVFNELADIVHLAVQKVTLDEAAAQVDKATEEFKAKKLGANPWFPYPEPKSPKSGGR